MCYHKINGVDKSLAFVASVVVWVLVIILNICSAKAEAPDGPFGCRIVHSSGEDRRECLDGTVEPVEPSFTRYGCYIGTIEVRNSGDLAFLQRQKCVKGDVTVQGIEFLNWEKFQTLDISNLEWVSGVLTIRQNQRLTKIEYKEELIVFRVIVEQNPVLNHEAATEFVESVGSENYRQTEQLNAP